MKLTAEISECVYPYTDDLTPEEIAESILPGEFLPGGLTREQMAEKKRLIVQAIENALAQWPE